MEISNCLLTSSTYQLKSWWCVSVGHYLFLMKTSGQNIRKLPSFNVQNLLIKVFYIFILESVLTFVMICWFGMISLRNQNLRGKIVTVCKVTGVSLNDFMYQVRAGQRAQVILLDSQQPTEEALTAIWAVLFHQLLAF